MTDPVDRFDLPAGNSTTDAPITDMRADSDCPLEMDFDWRGERAELRLHGRYDPAADVLLSEVADLVLNKRIRLLIIELTDLRPFAPPVFLRALLRLRARVRAAGVEVVVLRRSVDRAPEGSARRRAATDN